MKQRRINQNSFWRIYHQPSPSRLNFWRISTPMNAFQAPWQNYFRNQLLTLLKMDLQLYFLWFALDRWWSPMPKSHASQRPGANMTKFLCSLVDIAIFMSHVYGICTWSNRVGWCAWNCWAGSGRNTQSTPMQGQITITMLRVKENVFNTKVYCICKP